MRFWRHKDVLIVCAMRWLKGLGRQQKKRLINYDVLDLSVKNLSGRM